MSNPECKAPHVRTAFATIALIVGGYLVSENTDVSPSSIPIVESIIGNPADAAKKPDAKNIEAWIPSDYGEGGGDSACRPGDCRASSELSLAQIRHNQHVGENSKIVWWAKKQLGVNYSWGAGSLDGPTYGTSVSPAGQDATKVQGFDCSGFVFWALGKVGVPLQESKPNAAMEYHNVLGRPVHDSQIIPGDVVFFGTPDNIHHVAIIVRVEQDQFIIIEAPHSYSKISFRTVEKDYSDILGYRRFLFGDKKPLQPKSVAFAEVPDMSRAEQIGSYAVGS